MPLVENGQIVPDRYRYVGEDEPIPERVPVIVPAQRFLTSTDALIRRDGSLGVLWPNDRRIAELAPWLGHLALVALQFPKFRDGRAFSWARMLRQRLGFRGEVRAVGNFIYDQINYQHRVGFDAWAVPDDFTLEQFQRALAEITYVYQPSTDGRKTVEALREATRQH